MSFLARARRRDPKFFARTEPQFGPLASDCLIWTGARIAKHGGLYARVRRLRESWTGHRWSWYLAHGRRPPRGKPIRHRRDRTLCVHPDHVLAGTFRDNLLDQYKRGRRSA